MSESYQTQFILDKAYYRECFEQSETPKTFWQLYIKALMLSAFGVLLVLFTEINDYAAWFIFTLGVLEAVAQKYRQAWWVTRQMLSKESKANVNLLISDEGISTTSFYHQHNINWQNVTAISATELGYVISHPQGKSYLSKSHLNLWAKQLIEHHAQRLTASSGL